MASNRILSSKQVNKLQVNRLDAQAIRSDNIIPDSPSYLFSAIFNNGNFTRDSTGGTLTFTRSDVDSIIQFSDRPFRQTGNISFEEFVSLFGISDTFAEDPPNAVLVNEEEQRTYVVKLESSDSNSATFNLQLLPGESHNLGDINGRMSFFVDSSSSSTPLTVKQMLARLLDGKWYYIYYDNVKAVFKFSGKSFDSNSITYFFQESEFYIQSTNKILYQVGDDGVNKEFGLVHKITRY